MFSSLQGSRPQAQQPRPSNPQYQQQIRHATPQSQVEAMPPHAPRPPVAFDPATMHPVFFMHSYRKPPFAVPPTAGSHPVATGYVFGDARSQAASNTKL